MRMRNEFVWNLFVESIAAYIWLDESESTKPPGVHLRDRNTARPIVTAV